MGNEAQLAQLLQNLIGNAIKFVPAGTTPMVRVAATSVDDGWDVTVSDNGPGVPEAQRDRIFDMFSRAHGAEVPGTGLGLAICRKLVQRHGGRIWVDDATDLGGAAFHFVLPADLT
jgi:signal transduction histidine kinase